LGYSDIDFSPNNPFSHFFAVYPEAKRDGCGNTPLGFTPITKASHSLAIAKNKRS